MQLEQYVLNELHHLEHTSILRKLVSTQRIGGAIVSSNSSPYISFSCNDYFCLSSNPIVKQSAITAIQKYGLGSGSSRLITGNNDLYRILEEKLAQENNTESTTVFSSGYMANLGSIPALMSRYDLIIADKLIHSSLIDGSQLSRAKFIRFLHNDLNNCEEILKKNRHLYRNCLILAEHVYSMNGDVAPIEKIISLSKKYNCWTMVDDAHGFGIIKMKQQPDIYLGTLSKALGSLGGYICASKNIIQYLNNKARSLIYTTALPPAALAGSIVAIDIVKQLFGQPLKGARTFCEELGLPQPQSNIVVLTPSNRNETLIQKTLLENGFLVKTIKPPTVPTSRLRFTFTIAHTEIEIKRLCRLLKTLGY